MEQIYQYCKENFDPNVYTYSYMAQKCIEHFKLNVNKDSLRKRIGEYFKKVPKGVDDFNLKTDNEKYGYSIKVPFNTSTSLYESSKSFEEELNKFGNTLVIGDLHAPFTKKEALGFVKEVHSKYNCKNVIFMGDILDNHYMSYHETSTRAMGGELELITAKVMIKEWVDAFPKATVIIGNHDRLHLRQAQSSNIPSKWFKSYAEVLNTPGWNWVHEYVDDRGYYYVHGEGSEARVTALRKGLSTIQAHRHASCYVEYLRQDLFAVQVPTLVDESAYAFEYNRTNTKPWVSGCVVIDNGKPIIIPM